jgi:hypothetical protein
LELKKNKLNVVLFGIRDMAKLMANNSDRDASNLMYDETELSAQIQVITSQVGKIRT